MSKAAIADVEDLGVHKTTFDKSDAAWTPFVQAILDAVALEVAQAVGAENYSALAGSLTASRIVRLEALLAAAELLLRAESFAVRLISGEETSKIADSSRMRQRQRFLAEAGGILSAMGLPPIATAVDSTFSTPPQGAVGESSHFAEDQ